MSRTKYLLALHYALLVLLLTSHVYLGVYRAMPYNVMLKINREHDKGDTGVSVKAVHASAHELAPLPWWHLHQHLVWRGHDPGLFQLIAVLLIKIGVGSLFGLQMVGLGLTALALLLFYFLIRALFRDRWIALASILYIAFCPVFRNYATSIHVHSSGKVLMMGALLAYLYYFRSKRMAGLVLAIALYFLACWNHCFAYINGPLLFAGIHYVERRRVISRDLVALAAAPVLALSGFFAIMVAHCGGLYNAAKTLFGVAMFRFLDMPQPDGYFGDKFEPGDFVDLGKLGRHLARLTTRIEDWYYLSPAILAAMLAVVLFVHPKTRDNAYRVFLFWIPAAFIWHFTMIQHTIIHNFSAAYHYPLIALIFGCFVTETPRYVYRKLEGRSFRKTIGVLAIFPVLLPVVSGISADVLAKHHRYLVNHNRISSFTRELKACAAGPVSEAQLASLKEKYEEIKKEYYLSEEYKAETESMLSR